MPAKASTMVNARAKLERSARKVTATATNASNAAASSTASWNARRKGQRKFKPPKVHLGRSKMAKAVVRKVAATDGE